MNKLLYYPGCTVKRNAAEYERSSIAVLSRIGVEVIELDKWYCCGTLYGLAIDDLSKHLGALRVLVSAQKLSAKHGTNKLLTICPMCFNVLKRVNLYLRDNPEMLERASAFMEEEGPYKLGIEVVHVAEVIASSVDSIKKLATASPRGAAATAYYGCTIVRPKEVGIDNPEDPTILERLLEELGFRVVDNPHKTLCCGSYYVLLNKDVVISNSKKVVREAISRGAELVVAVCPLCVYNLRETLKSLGGRASLSVVYLTDVVAYALGLRDAIDASTLSILDRAFSK